MRILIIYFLVLSAIAVVFTGCSKESTETVGGGMATQGTPPTLSPAEVEMSDELAELNRELKRWIVSSKENPVSFEDFVAKAGVTVPPAPAGKKFSISKERRVVLVDQ